MRLLEFIVNKQSIRKKLNCDFSHIVAGSVGYLKAAFYFSEDWTDCAKAASFWDGDNEYAVLLDKNDCCVIPEEVLLGDRFSVSVTGAKSGYKIGTNKVRVRQEVR